MCHATPQRRKEENYVLENYEPAGWKPAPQFNSLLGCNLQLHPQENN
jgi:hypothetical protein